MRTGGQMCKLISLKICFLYNGEISESSVHPSMKLRAMQENDYRGIDNDDDYISSHTFQIGPDVSTSDRGVR